MKYAISFFGILLLVICAMLFFQYQVYSDQVGTGSEEFSYTQEIEITYRSGSLDIHHHFRNLSNKEIDISWPKRAVGTGCFLEGKTSCDRLNEDKTKFAGGEARNASLSYVIPLDGKLESKQLLKDIFVTLKNGHATYSTVHITTDKEIQGQWITGLPLVGMQSLSLVNYAMFDGTGQVSEIYWHSGELAHLEVSDHLTIYSKTALGEDLRKQLKSLAFLNDDHLAVVQGANVSGQQGNRILFLEELSAKAMNKMVLLAQVDNEFDFEGSAPWVREVMASFLANAAIGSSKSIEMVNTLKSRLTEQQYQEWQVQLRSLKGESITTKRLDDLLSSVFGISTNYFSMNEKTKTVYPLLFIDKRDIFIENKKSEDITVVLKDGNMLYSLDSTLESFGYQVSVGKNGYYVQNAAQKFRFPLNYGFYVYNEQRYNTLSEPVQIIEGEFYMEESWLQRLFHIDILKNEDSITLKRAN